MENKTVCSSNRYSWDEYFLKVTFLISERSTCLRRNVGAIAVKDRRIIATGYNGACRGLDDCLKLGCLREEKGIESGTRHEICRAVHAEQNVIIQSALAGNSIEGAIIYCTNSPCILCAKMLVNAKIKKCICAEDYPDKQFIKLFWDAKIEYQKLILK